MTMETRLAEVFQKAFNLDPKNFSPALAPEDVPNWDSIGHMNLVAHLEEEFQRQFEVDEIMEMSSPAKILEILKAKGVSD
jgi:acyl carrier protein